MNGNKLDKEFDRRMDVLIKELVERRTGYSNFCPLSLPSFIWQKRLIVMGMILRRRRSFNTKNEHSRIRSRVKTEPH